MLGLVLSVLESGVLLVLVVALAVAAASLYSQKARRNYARAMLRWRTLILLYCRRFARGRFFGAAAAKSLGTSALRTPGSSSKECRVCFRTPVVQESIMYPAHSPTDVYCVPSLEECNTDVSGAKAARERDSDEDSADSVRGDDELREPGLTVPTSQSYADDASCFGDQQAQRDAGVDESVMFSFQRSALKGLDIIFEDSVTGECSDDSFSEFSGERQSSGDEPPARSEAGSDQAPKGSEQDVYRSYVHFDAEAAREMEQAIEHGSAVLPQSPADASPSDLSAARASASDSHDLDCAAVSPGSVDGCLADCALFDYADADKVAADFALDGSSLEGQPEAGLEFMTAEQAPFGDEYRRVSCMGGASVLGESADELNTNSSLSSPVSVAEDAPQLFSDAAERAKQPAAEKVSMTAVSPGEVSVSEPLEGAAACDGDLGVALTLKERGNEALRNGDPHSALQSYKDALAAAPSSNVELRAVLFSNLSKVYGDLEQWDEAYEAASECVRHSEGYAKGQFRLYRAAVKLEKVHDAANALAKAASLDVAIAQSYGAELAKLKRRSEEQFEREKAEMLDKLKSFGNWALGKFGMSINDFELIQDPASGAYSVQYRKQQPV